MAKENFEVKIGKAIWIPGCKEVGIVLGRYKEPENCWLIALRKTRDDIIQILPVLEKDISPYKNHCWNKDCDSRVDSSKDETCPQCGWVICPSCGYCKQDHQPHPNTNGLIIYPAPFPFSKPIPTTAASPRENEELILDEYQASIRNCFGIIDEDELFSW